MQKCIVFGNCQADFIKLYLKSSATFSQTYEIIDHKPVHAIKEIDESLLKSCDLFIYQVVGNTYGEKLSTDYLLSRLPDSCTTISIPNTYFKGYHPQHGYNPTIKPDPYYSNKPSGMFPYGDLNIIKLLKDGLGKEEIIKVISDEDFYSKEEVMGNLRDTLDELKRREQGLDIKISDFIEKYYKEHHLFYSVNHPNYKVTHELVMRIFDRIGISSDDIKHKVIDAFSKTLHVPIYPSVIKHLGLTFVDKDSKYSFYLNKGGDEVSFKEYVSKYIDHATS